MARWVAVSSGVHARQRWRRYSAYHFAAEQAVVELVGAELPKAALALPIALVPRSAEAAAGFMPAAVLGLQPGQSLFVGSDGRWLGRYVPAALRAHPYSSRTDHRRAARLMRR